MKILKFGGKSLETLEKTQKICKYIKKIYKNDKKIIIIVSAMGNTTNDLLEMVKKYNPEKHSKRDLDALLSTGETLSSSVFSIILNSMGVPAKSFQSWQIKIKTKGDFQNSLITEIEKVQICDCLNSNTVAVVAGFQGVNDLNEITTLGRGGSDTTACAFGAVFQTNVELYSDFDGIFAGDPRSANYKKIKRISLSTLDEVTNCGSKIVSNRAVKLAKKNNFSILLKSSSEPCKKGSVASGIESNTVSIIENNNLCELLVVASSETKLKFIVKNVYLWLNNYKLYNLTIKNNIISIIINQADKNEILEMLNKKIKLLKN